MNKVNTLESYTYKLSEEKIAEITRQVEEWVISEKKATSYNPTKMELEMKSKEIAREI